jgi:hypothetical protein
MRRNSQGTILWSGWMTIPTPLWHEYIDVDWVGTLGRQLLGPIVLPIRLTGAVFWPITYQYSWNMYLFINDNMRFKHDRPQPHCLRTVRQHLNQTFSDQRIGRGGPFSCPARSPDISTLDFWLWVHLKTLVYSEPINGIQVLKKPVRRFE